MPILTMTHKLGCPNPLWKNPQKCPVVTATCRRNDSHISFLFDVVEPPSCFRCVCRDDGDPCWQDSCVEIFAAVPHTQTYANIETNSAGVSLAQWGTRRDDRIEFTSSGYGRIRRDVLVLPTKTVQGFIHWAVEIAIPSELMHVSEFDPVIGNVYKCGSCSETPHYLSRFPVDSPSPDFHRPECFRNLFL